MYPLLMYLLTIFIVGKLIHLFISREPGETWKTQIKEFTMYIGFVVMSACTVAMYTIFFVAFFSPDKVVLVTINLFGEAKIEIILLTSVIPCVIYFFWQIRKYREKFSEKGLV